MKVWCVCVGDQYDGFDLERIFDSEGKAKTWIADQQDPEYYYIEEKQVE